MGLKKPASQEYIAHSEKEKREPAGGGTPIASKEEPGRIIKDKDHDTVGRKD